MRKYYLAYGSNLSVAQMLRRCPFAVYVGKGEIKDYRLLFKGSKTGSYLTIEKKKGGTVPVLVWEISTEDEKNLDIYEGYPSFYYKKEIEIEVESFVENVPPAMVKALVYIMDEQRAKGIPSIHYYDTCLEGYCRFGFEIEILEQALKDSAGVRMAEKLLKEIRNYV